MTLRTPDFLEMQNADSAMRDAMLIHKKAFDRWIGLGGEVKDRESALELLAESAKLGFVPACLDLALLHEKKHNYVKSLELIQAAARQAEILPHNHVHRSFHHTKLSNIDLLIYLWTRIARYYVYGIGCQKDENIAKKWIYKSIQKKQLSFVELNYDSRERICKCLLLMGEIAAQKATNSPDSLIEAIQFFNAAGEMGLTSARSRLLGLLDGFSKTSGRLERAAVSIKKRKKLFLY
jgi:hypothetical protein